MCLHWKKIRSLHFSARFQTGAFFLLLTFNYKSKNSCLKFQLQGLLTLKAGTVDQVSVQQHFIRGKSFFEPTSK